MWILIFIGIDGAEGEVLSGRLTLGQHVEEGRFPHVRYSDYTNFQIGPDTANKRFPFRFLDFLWRHPRKNRNLYRHHFPLPPSLPQFDPSREKRRFIFSTLLTRGSRQTEEKKKTIYQYLHIHGARVRGRRNENDSAFVGIRAPRLSSSSIPTLGIFNICPRPCLERNQRGRVK